MGTVQFGMDYGINNPRGKVPAGEAHEILMYALENGIDTLDSAHAYGDSERVIGEFIKLKKPQIKLISKLSSSSGDRIEDIVEESLQKLHLKSLYGYLIHDFNFFVKDPAIWDVLRHLKHAGKVEKIGFSLYFPKDLQYLWEHNIQTDLVQVPYSIFDQRFSPMFAPLKERGAEIHIRSVFLQGLVFKNIDELDGKFSKMREKLLLLRSLSEQIGVPVSGLCINFAALNQYVDKIIIGVDSLDNLKENIGMGNYQDKVSKIYSKLSSLSEDDEDIIIPSNWDNAWKH